MGEYPTKGQFISANTFFELKDIPNMLFDEFLRQYDIHLIDKQICPKCYNKLSAPDHQIEAVHCHNCKWIEKYE